ncbi:MAG: hypothetical protein K2L11_11965 [Muribaculaceae bacterium]|nr:hypothetical protein [Muribaculaceae bacterium]
MSTYFDQVASELLEDPYFQNFKFRKYDSSLIQRTRYCIQIINLEHWNCFNISLSIRPHYGVRFELLCKWFEKFSFKSLRDQRNGCYVSFNGRMVGEQNTYEFPYYETGQIYKDELRKLRADIIGCSKFVFDEYSTLEKAYQNKILPILEGKQKLPGVGADWFFENLTLCKILHPEKYEELKEIHLRHAEEMIKKEEPNMSIYYPRLEEILSYMENQDFKIP